MLPISLRCLECFTFFKRKKYFRIQNELHIDTQAHKKIPSVRAFDAVKKVCRLTGCYARIIR